jgi:hypothetical protein
MATIKEQAIQKIMDSTNAEVKELLKGSSLTPSKMQEIYDKMKLNEAMNLIDKLKNEDDYDAAMLEIEETRNKWRASAKRAEKAREGRKKKVKESETPKKEPEAEKK